MHSAAVWHNDVFTLQQKPIRHTNYGKQRNENSGILHGAWHNLDICQPFVQHRQRKLYGDRKADVVNGVLQTTVSFIGSEEETVLSYGTTQERFSGIKIG